MKRTIHMLLLAVAALTCVGCGIPRVPKRGAEFEAIRPVPKDKAVVYFFRMNGLASKAVQFRLNTIPVAALPKNTSYAFVAEPGVYLVSLAPTQGMIESPVLQRMYVFKAGTEYFLEANTYGSYYSLRARSREEGLIKLLVTNRVLGTPGILPKLDAGPHRWLKEDE